MSAVEPRAAERIARTFHRIAREPAARHAELLEANGIELVDDPAVNSLGRNPQQGADQHLVCDDRRGR